MTYFHCELSNILTTDEVRGCYKRLTWFISSQKVTFSVLREINPSEFLIILHLVGFTTIAETTGVGNARFTTNRRFSSQTGMGPDWEQQNVVSDSSKFIG